MQRRCGSYVTWSRRLAAIRTARVEVVARADNRISHRAPRVRVEQAKVMSEFVAGISNRWILQPDSFRANFGRAAKRIVNLRENDRIQIKIRRIEPGLFG